MLQFIHIIIKWATLHWELLSALVGGGAGLSVFLQVVLHSLHINSKKLAYSLLHLLALLGAASMYYLDNKSVLPTYSALVIVAQTVHRFIVSPYYAKYVVPYLTFLSENAVVPTPAVTEPVVEATPATGFVN